MSKVNDGGAAFPGPYSERALHRDFGMGAPQSGMSLRDWMAGQALASGDYRDADEYAKAEQCYIMADAMLKARKAND